MTINIKLVLNGIFCGGKSFLKMRLKSNTIAIDIQTGSRIVCSSVMLTFLTLLPLTFYLDIVEQKSKSKEKVKKSPGLGPVSV